MLLENENYELANCTALKINIRTKIPTAATIFLDQNRAATLCQRDLTTAHAYFIYILRILVDYAYVSQPKNG